jgi:ATPase family AAA domain-containing protein 3A/B
MDARGGGAHTHEGGGRHQKKKNVKKTDPPPPPPQVIELARQQELTKQAETKKAEAEFAAAAARANVEQERVRWEEQRKTVQADASAKAQLAQYNDELARKRADREHEAARARNAELVSLQEEGVRRQEAERVRAAAAVEAERRATAQYQAGLDKEIARERALAEAEGRAAEARANEDVNRRALLLKLEEDRRRVLDSINAIFSNVGSAGAALLADRARLSAAVAGFSALALGIYGAREGARVAARAADRWLGTPALVRETSLARWWRPGSGAKAGAPAKGADAVKRDFSDIILPRPLGDTVRGLAAATSATRAHGAPFRHMLFYGPPGEREEEEGRGEEGGEPTDETPAPTNTPPTRPPPPFPPLSLSQAPANLWPPSASPAPRASTTPSSPAATSPRSARPPRPPSTPCSTGRNAPRAACSCLWTKRTRFWGGAAPRWGRRRAAR